MFMVNEPTWPICNTLAQFSRRARILRSHQEAGIDAEERKYMAEVFEVAWVDFFEKIVKAHFPDKVSSIQEMYDAHLIEYPPVMSYKVVDVTPGGELVPAPEV